MIIYLITNTNTNKAYVGQTVRALEVRWQGHLARARQPRTAESANTHLYNSMRKPGIENFTKEDIEKATLAKQKSVVVLYKGTEYKFSSIKQSCVWVNENVFDNKFGIRSIQGMVTRSRKRGCAINEVTWIYQ